MSEENKRSFEEMMAEYQELMKRQVELQKEMFGSQLGMMNQIKGPIEEALKTFMGSFTDAMKASAPTAKTETETEATEDSEPVENLK